MAAGTRPRLRYDWARAAQVLALGSNATAARYSCSDSPRRPIAKSVSARFQRRKALSGKIESAFAYAVSASALRSSAARTSAALAQESNAAARLKAIGDLAGNGAVAQSTGNLWISSSVSGERRTKTAEVSSRYTGRHTLLLQKSCN